MAMQELMTEPMKQVHALRLDLQQISDRGTVGNVAVPWVFTNDFSLHQVLGAVPETTELPKDTLGVYLILGTGGVLSAARRLQDRVDIVLVIDNNSFVLDWMNVAFSTLQRTTTPDEYREKMRNHELWGRAQSELRTKGESLDTWEHIERQALGEEHFLHTHQNFQESQRALRGKPVVFSSGNMLHTPYVYSLRQALTRHNAQIVCASVTDTADWHAAFTQQFAGLPFTKDAFIYWSTNKGSDNGHPIAKSSLGVHAYAQEAEAQRLQTSYQLLDATQAS